MAEKLPLRLRYNYVLSEVDFVLFDDLAAYAIVTEDFLCRIYEKRFSKDLKSELKQLDVTLRALIEQEFATHLKWWTDSEFNAVVRRASINSRRPVESPAEDMNANIVPPMTLQINTKACLPVAADGYATPAWKDNRELQELLSNLRESETFVADDQLAKTRTTIAAKHYQDRHPMAMNFVDYYALTKFGEYLILDIYDGFRDWADFDGFKCKEFGRELKDVRLRIVGDSSLDAFYGFHHPVILWNDMKHNNRFRESDLAFPRLPQIAVFKRGQRNATKKQPLAYVPMERLEIFDDKQLIFACVRLARLQQLPPTNEQAVQPECLIEI